MWGLRFCIADKLPAKTDAAGLRPHRVAKPRAESFKKTEAYQDHDVINVSLSQSSILGLGLP